MISFLLVVTLAALIVTNMPASHTKDRLWPLADPYLNALGLDQNWAIFAPNPRNPIVFVETHIDYADGTSAVRPSRPSPGLAAYRDYRWHKFAEQMRLDRHADVWPAFARFVVERERAAGRGPARVTLVRRVSEMLPPGPGPENGPWIEERFFTLDLGAPS